MLFCKLIFAHYLFKKLCAHVQWKDYSCFDKAFLNEIDFIISHCLPGLAFPADTHGYNYPYWLQVYIRGNAEDFNRWESEGAEGWSYADCLPYFKKAQCHELGENDYRGGQGFLNVSRGKCII